MQTWFSTRFAARFSTSSCGLRHAFDMLSTFFVEKLVANLLRQSWHVTHVRSSLGFKHVCSWLSTCFQHAFDLLATCFRHAHASRKPGLQPCLQLDRIMKCGLYNTVTRCRAKLISSVRCHDRLLHIFELIDHSPLQLYASALRSWHTCLYLCKLRKIRLLNFLTSNVNQFFFVKITLCK